MGRAVVVGLPVWVLLLGLLPLSGLGPGPCLALATLVALGAVIWADRSHARRTAAPADAAHRPRAARRQMGPLAAAGLTLGVVLVLVYVIFVFRA